MGSSVTDLRCPQGHQKAKWGQEVPAGDGRGQSWVPHHAPALEISWREMYFIIIFFLLINRAGLGLWGFLVEEEGSCLWTWGLCLFWMSSSLTSSVSTSGVTGFLLEHS